MRECEEMLKIVQRNRNSRLDLTSGLRLASHQKLTRAKHARNGSVSQLEHYRTKSTDWQFSYLAAGTYDLVKPRVQAASQLCFEKLDSSYSILTLV